MGASPVNVIEARNVVSQRSESVIQRWNELRWFLNNHAKDITRRWEKRGSAKRITLLKTVWPEIPASRRPDIDAHNRGDITGRTCRGAFLCPILNLEALISSSVLLIFLNARGRDCPASFIMPDARLANFGIFMGHIQVPDIPNHNVKFSSQSAPDSYGKLIPNDAIDGSDQKNMCQVVRSGEGLLCLEIQEFLYGFLVKCCKMLLPDIVPSENHPKEYIGIGSMPCSIEAEQLDLNRSFATALETPYRPPTEFNINGLLLLVDAKRSSAVEHMRDLREDPQYFSEILLGRREHRPECLKPPSGIRCPPPDERILWTRIIRDTLQDAYADLFMWEEVHRQLRNIEEMLGSDNQSLNTDLEWAVANLIWRLEHMARYPVANLQKSLHASPQMRRFMRVRNSDSMLFLYPSEEFLRDKKRRQLLQAIQMLYHQNNWSTAGLPTLMDALEHIISGQNSLKALLSPYVMAIISDLSVLTECLREISLYQPWISMYEKAMRDRQEEMRREFNRTAKHWIIDLDKNIDLAALGNPKSGRFSCPTRKRTKESTAQIQQAEVNLDNFWATVDGGTKGSAGNSIVEDARAFFAKCRVPYRTPNRSDEPVEILRSPSPPKSANGYLYSLSDYYAELELRTGGAIQSRSELGTQKKTKTRGIAKPPGEALAATSIIRPHAVDTPPRLPVSKKALKIFNMMLSSGSTESRRGEIPWVDFQHAMASAGFGFRSLTGSAWQFWKERMGSIQVHRPHPSGNFRFDQLRNIGNRLNRAFGWTVETFVAECQ